MAQISNYVVVVVDGGNRLGGLSAAHTLLEKGVNTVVLDSTVNTTAQRSESKLSGANEVAEIAPGAPKVFFSDVKESAGELLRGAWISNHVHTADATTWVKEKFHLSGDKLSGTNIAAAEMQSLRSFAQNEPNRIQIIERAVATTLIKDGDQVVGVEYTQDGKRFKLNGPVVLDAGAEFTENTVFSIGGAQVDSRSYVIDISGQPIAGLFVAGKSLGGVPQNDDGLGGSSLLGCVELGRVAGAEAALYQRHSSSATSVPRLGQIGMPRTKSGRDARIPLEYRTLSIQIYDSQRATEAKSDRADPQSFERVEFHKITPDALCRQFNVSMDRGLDSAVVARRLARDGPNSLSPKKTYRIRTLLTYIFGDFCAILWVAVIIFFICWRPLSDPPSPTNLALAIVVILVISLQAGFRAFQDWSTGKVMDSILNLLPSECVVIREGQSLKVSATELVVGDIVRLSSGNKVPADMRIIRASDDIKFDRSILTGEAEAIPGTVDSTDENFLETQNVAMMGTHVVNGTADCIVIFVGDRTVMGRISHLTNSAKEEPTLIQKEITRFVIIIIILTGLLALLILLTWIGWLRVKYPNFLNVVGMLNNVMGCVVAFIPEGMPIGVALTLSLIARRMKAASVLPKSMSTVETLGCVNVICSDKTGTLTSGKMTATQVGFVDFEISVDDLAENFASQADSSATLRELQRAIVLCNSASFDSSSSELPIEQRKINGDATDSSAFLLGERLGNSDAVREAQPLVCRIPFNSKSKYMVSIHTAIANDKDTTKSPFQFFIKGAPDVLLPFCTSYWSYSKNEILPFDYAARQQLLVRQSDWSSRGQRVILLCTRAYDSPEVSVHSNDFATHAIQNGLNSLVVVGLVGIVDPPRPETAHTVRECRRAGARFFMVTGDFGLTASAIAREVGIFTNERMPDVLQDLQFHEKKDLPDSSSTHSLDFSPRIGSAPAATSSEHTVHGSDAYIPKALILEGKDFDNIEPADWDLICQYEEVVFARTSPEQKLKIVVELRNRDFVVAVTGDGVNDSPALRAANVGIAMVEGSDVAIEAANLVLVGSFASIIDGIRLGRLVFQNLQKVISYLLPAGSFSEIWPVILNVFTGVPLPLSSFLMIIICCFTDTLGCLSLIMEKEEFDLLSLPPRNSKKDHLVNFRIYAQSYLFIGVMETVMAHSMFFLYYWKYAGIPASALFLAFDSYADGFYGYAQADLTNFNNVGQSVYFVTLVVLQWGNLLSIRNKRLSILQADPFRKERRNLWLFASMLFSFVVAVFVTEVPWFQDTFGTAPVPIEFWLIPVPLAVGILAMDEIRKLTVRVWPKGPTAAIAW